MNSTMAKQEKNSGKGQPKRTNQWCFTPDPDVRAALDRYIAGQEVAPDRSSVCNTALRAWLKERFPEMFKH